MHIFDRYGKILNSTLTPEQNLTGMEVVGSYVGEHIHESDVLPFLRKIERCLEKGTEIVTYRVEGFLFLGKMEKFSSNRVRMFDYNINNLELKEVLEIFSA